MKMCGIFFVLCFDQDLNDIQNLLTGSFIRCHLLRRGPDHHQTCQLHFQNQNGTCFAIYVESSVLHLRGNLEQTEHMQPRLQNDSFLQWNGEIFQLIDDDSDDDVIEQDPHQNDTTLLFEMLINNKSSIPDCIRRIRGPYAFTFYDSIHKHLWFARDILGRRSLCWNTNFREKYLVISSLAHLLDEPACCDHPFSKMKFEEIPVGRIFQIDLSMMDSANQMWSDMQTYHNTPNIIGQQLTITESNERMIYGKKFDKFNESIPCQKTDHLLRNCIKPEQVIPEEVCHQLYDHMFQSVYRRCRLFNGLCRKCKQQSSPSSSTTPCPHAHISILFSGGLDSAVLSVLAHHCLTKLNDNSPIDLLNVSFQDNAPDRETGLKCWMEICDAHPQRVWNFVSIDVNQQDLNDNRRDIIKLIKPNNTVLDESIGSALWFAARGQGVVRCNADEQAKPYKTTARITLVGMGADEQLGGYSRHQKMFNGHCGHDHFDYEHAWSMLVDEMKMDMLRIPYRNLGRDDRIIGDHCLESRMPYLDESLISFLNQLPVWYKTNPYLCRGQGEKWLLRWMARRHLKLTNSSQHWKRAIQFGSKFVKKQQHNKLNGSDLIQ